MSGKSYRHAHYLAIIIVFLLGLFGQWIWTRLLPIAPVPKIITFHGVSVEPHDDLRPGDRIEVTFFATWNHECEYQITPRFLNRDTGAIDGDVTRAAVLSSHPTTETGTLDILPVNLTLPENIFAARWSYLATVTPGPACPTQEIIITPLADFTVSFDASECTNIRGSANYIYHVPGSSHYDRVTTPIACFESVEQAKEAKFRSPAQ